MVEIRIVARALALFALALVLALVTIAQPAAAQQKGGGELPRKGGGDDTATAPKGGGDVPKKGGGQGWHECQYGSGRYVHVADVDEGHAHFHGIISMLCLGIMNTDADGDFHSNTPATRAGAASATLRLFEYRTKRLDHCDAESGSWPRPFVDVDESTPHGQEVVAAWCRSIWNGVSADHFNPLASLRRDQAASAVLRLLDAVWLEENNSSYTELGRRSTEPTFTDVDPDSTHAEAIGILAADHIIHGVTCDFYRPSDPLTRGQLATILSVARYQHVGKGGHNDPCQDVHSYS